jgi:hypothetical protein
VGLLWGHDKLETEASTNLLRSMPMEASIGITFLSHIECNGVTAIKLSMTAYCTDNANQGREPLPRKREASVLVLVIVVTVVVV